MIQEFFPVLDAVPMGDLWVLLIWGLLIMSVWMFIVWVWSMKVQNAGLVNFGWASGLACVGVFYAFKADGYGPRRVMIGLMVFLWGARWAHRLWMAREPIQNHDHSGLKSFFSFGWRAIFAVFMSVPFALLAIDPLQKITVYEWLGLGLWLMSMIGQEWLPSQSSFFEWLVWAAYFLSALETSYGGWTILCPIAMFVYLRNTHFYS